MGLAEAVTGRVVEPAVIGWHAWRGDPVARWIRPEGKADPYRCGWVLVSAHAAAACCRAAVPVLPRCLRVPGSRFSAACPAGPGLTAAPRAFRLSAPLAARDSRFRAALTSRSSTRPQHSHR